MKTPRGTSESSTTSDNTTEFIDIVKKYDVVYNTHNPDYKNVEVKMKVWSQIAEEIGLSVGDARQDASKRKWKNLRDSYTKYLRSFRIGTKTSKKYQYWAHADHMEFLKPYQGPGRTSGSGVKSNGEEDTECDLGFQVLAKASTASTASTEDDIKVVATTATATSTSTSTSAITSQATPTTSAPAITTSSSTLVSMAAAASSSLSVGSTATTTSHVSTPQSSAALMMPMPSLPTVQLPPHFIGKSVGAPLPTLPSLPTTVSPQVFSLPALAGNSNSNGNGNSNSNSSKSSNVSSMHVPVSNTASSVGCMIIEPPLLSAAESYKKEMCTPGLGLYQSISSHGTPTPTAKINPPLITKIRRVPSSQQTPPAVNLATAPISTQPPPMKTRKIGVGDATNAGKFELDVSAILHANRDLDANTLFFLSLAKTVRSMPMKFQSLAKMRCMRIVSDLELELENAAVECNGPVVDDVLANGTKYSNSDSPLLQGNCAQVTGAGPDTGTEHFVYVMSPSRVESMIDISSEDENTMNGI